MPVGKGKKLSLRWLEQGKGRLKAIIFLIHDWRGEPGSRENDNAHRKNNVRENKNDSCRSRMQARQLRVSGMMVPLMSMVGGIVFYQKREEIQVCPFFLPVLLKMLYQLRHFYHFRRIQPGKQAAQEQLQTQNYGGKRFHSRKDAPFSVQSPTSFHLPKSRRCGHGTAS
jgi:hypothetical protein